MQYNPEARLRRELFAILAVNTAVGALLLSGKVMLASVVAVVGAAKFGVFLCDWREMHSGDASVAAVGCDE